MPRPSVLLVDDDDSFLKEYVQIFHARHYHVLTAHSGKETKKIIKKVHPTIAFLDKKLTDMDGEDLIEEFKSKSKNTSLVVMTGHASMKSTIKSLKAGVVDYMIKPLDPDIVVRRVEEIIQSRKNERRRFKKLRHWADLQNQKYKYLFEGSCGAVFIVDVSDGTIIDCNPAVLTLMSRQKPALIGKSFLSCFTVEDAQKHEGFFKSCEKNGPMVMETRVVDAQNHLVSVSMSASVLTIGRKKYMQVIMHDLKKLVEVKGIAAEQEHKYHLLADTAVEGIYQVNEKGVFVFVNQAFTEIFGYRVEEMLGESFMLIIADQYADKARSMVSTVLKGEVVKGDFTCRHKTGREVFAHFSIVPLKIRDEIKGFTGILLDMTKQRLLEDELRYNASRLEEAVAIRTQELKNAMVNLEIANERLKIDDSLKSEFLANVAHEIKNPLFLVRENISCIRDGLLGEVGEKIGKSLDVARHEIDRLLRLTANMLDLNKLELGKMPLRKESFDIKGIFEDIIFSFEDKFKKKNIELIVDTQNSPFVCVGG